MSLEPAVIQNALIFLLMMIGSLTLHEWGHAWSADKLGDNTPRSEGRVTLNPLAHIDPIGTVILPLLGALGFFGSFGMFGWAKPVPINPGNYRRRNRDQAIVTIAGPAMNLLVAIVVVFAIAICERVAPAAVSTLILLLRLNVVLIVFNLLPIPPLDGSKFLMYWFGMGEEAYYNFARYGWIILIVLLNLGPFRALFSTLLGLALYPFGLLLNLLSP